MSVIVIEDECVSAPLFAHSIVVEAYAGVLVNKLYFCIPFFTSKEAEYSLLLAKLYVTPDPPPPPPPVPKLFP